VTVIAIMFMPNPFSLNHFICELIYMGALGNGGMGVDGEPDEDGGTDDCSLDENIPHLFFLHRSLRSPSTV